MTAPQEPLPDLKSAADLVARHPCPKCKAAPGSPCRSRSGAVTSAYHTSRVTRASRT
ncbi:zinc finger domain-containing protein [Streptomyces atroolivaceus]